MNSLFEAGELESAGIRADYLEPERFPWPRKPYKGLNFFLYGDAPLFGERREEAKKCAALLGSSTNRILLLHGRSGAGKSSFIRAGLLPELTRSKFAVLRLEMGKEPLVIRCTADPIERIREALSDVLEKKDSPLFIPDSARAAALAALGPRISTENRCLEMDRLLQTLSIFSETATRPLLFVVDQNEEIFTLSAGEDIHNRRQAFFQFLEELCLRSPHVKFIVSLRTEYYGQFCEHLSLDPNSRLSLFRTALDHFMLQGLRSREQIKAVILRPTLNSPVGDFGIPYSHYRFNFGERVPDLMVTDLFEHCGEASILPVLQIVCRDLYDKVITETNRVISEYDYDRLGRVAGRVQAFIEHCIYRVIRENDGLAWRRTDIARWQTVISALVARQEGGALTTLLLDEQDLLRRAKRAGLHGANRTHLDKMAEEDRRLLRAIVSKVPEGEVRQYSLGHDALAPALYQTRVTQEQVRTTIRLRRSFTVGTLLALVIIGIGFGQGYAIRSQVLSINNVADDVRSPDFSLKLLLLLSALDASSGPIWSRVLPSHETEASLKDILSRTPVLRGSAVAVGVSPFDPEMATLEQDGRLAYFKFNAERSSVGGMTKEPSGKIIWRESAPTNLPPQPSIGFIKGLHNPVVYQGGVISWWPDDSDLRSPAREVKLDSLVQFDTGGWKIVEISGGVFRVTQFSFGSGNRQVLFHDVKFTSTGSPGFSALPTSPPLQVSPPFAPTFSPQDEMVAFIESPFGPNSRLRLSTRNDLGKVATIPLEPDPPRNHGPQEFTKSISFSMGELGVALRDGTDRFSAWPLSPDLSPGPAVHFDIPKDLQDSPVRHAQGFSRPVLGSLRRGQEWLFAWLGKEGVLMLAGYEGGSSKSRLTLLPGVALASVSRMDFVRDGSFLVLQSQLGWSQPVAYRVWNLTPEYVAGIKEKPISDLKALACKVIGGDTGSSEQLKSDDVEPFDRSKQKVCGIDQ